MVKVYESSKLLLRAASRIWIRISSEPVQLYLMRLTSNYLLNADHYKGEA